MYAWDTRITLVSRSSNNCRCWTCFALTRGEADRLRLSTVREYTVWYNDRSKRVWVHAQLKASRKNDEEKSEECRLETETVENSFHPTYFSKLKVRDTNRMEGVEKVVDTEKDMRRKSGEWARRREEQKINT